LLVESCFKNKLHLKDYSTVASTSMMSTVGTSVHSKEQPQEMRFFRATSFMIWWSRRISFVQHLLLGGYEETTDTADGGGSNNDEGNIDGGGGLYCQLAVKV
jgi:hypothetical protein